MERTESLNLVLRSLDRAVGLLEAGSPRMRDSRWFEKNIGPLVPVEIVLEVDPGESLDLLRTLELVRRVEREMGNIDVLRSVRAGLIAMIPNVFPAVILFGLMGWKGMAVDIGSVMTASVALGIAVDGTIHFLDWFRRETQRGHSPQAAVRRAYGHCGRALVQTTLICSLGLIVYTKSGFVPAQRFSWMILLLLVVALAGDLILLPSLLLGRFGRWFLPPGTAAAAGKPCDLPLLVHHPAMVGSGVRSAKSAGNDSGKVAR